MFIQHKQSIPSDEAHHESYGENYPQYLDLDICMYKLQEYKDSDSFNTSPIFDLSSIQALRCILFEHLQSELLDYSRYANTEQVYANILLTMKQLMVSSSDNEHVISARDSKDFDIDNSVVPEKYRKHIQHAFADYANPRILQMQKEAEEGDYATCYYAFRDVISKLVVIDIAKKSIESMITHNLDLEDKRSNNAPSIGTPKLIKDYSFPEENPDSTHIDITILRTDGHFQWLQTPKQ